LSAVQLQRGDEGQKGGKAKLVFISFAVREIFGDQRVWDGQVINGGSYAVRHLDSIHSAVDAVDQGRSRRQVGLVQRGGRLVAGG